MRFVPTNHRSMRAGRRHMTVGVLTLTLSISAYLACTLGSSGVSDVAASGQTRFFSSTGHSVGGTFLLFFDGYGGVSVFGYPISDPINENGRTVQYFERQRFEYHGESGGTSNAVQLSRLGAEIAPASAQASYSQPFNSRSNQVYFQESRHSLRSPFLDYWMANGGLRILGYPVTEPYNENGRLVQYFERARMEYHPELGSGERGVLLGLLGRQFLSIHADIASRLSASSRGALPVARVEAPASGATLNGQEATLLDSINNVRRQQGMSAVTLDTTLRQMALARSNDMVARSYFSHTTPDGATIFSMLKNANISYKYAGEIIANNNYPDGQTAAEAFNGFMNSLHHHDIMLDPRYTIAGVGDATDARGFHYFTVIFLQP